MGVQRYARRDESIKGAEFALKQEKKKSWLKYVLVFGLILLITQTNITATRQANAEKYKALTYKLENEACRDQFGLLNKEIIDEVQRWNVKVTYYKAMEDNFWVGIYYPDVYGDLGTIDYETYEGGQKP